MRTDNILRGQRRSRPPYLEVRPTSSGLTKLAGLARLWQRAYLYRAEDAERVILAADELEGMQDRLMAVVANLTVREFQAFFAHELTERAP